MPTSNVRRAFALAILLLGFFAGGASADDQKVDQKKIAAAQNHYKRASAFQDLSEYDKAVKEYIEAYRLFPHPEFLFNIGEVYRLKGDTERALEYLEKYLELEPDGRGSADARQRITELEKQLVEEHRAGQERSPEASGDNQDEKEESVEGEAAVEDQPGAEATDPRDDLTEAPPATSTGAGRGLRIGGLATMGAGAVAMVIGVKFGLDASRISGEVDEADPWDEALYRDGETAQRNMFIAYGVGAAAVVGGALLYYQGRKAGRRSRSEHRVAVTPVVDSTAAGLAVAGRF